MSVTLMLGRGVADRELILVGMTPDDIYKTELIFWVSIISQRNTLAIT